jgi:hypothetical protein
LLIDVEAHGPGCEKGQEVEETDGQQLSKHFSTPCIKHVLTSQCHRTSEETRQSSVYGFLKKNVEVKYENGCKFHLLQCAVKKCKANGVVQQYLDSKDCMATSNLKTHAIICFGIDAIKSADNKMKSSPHDRLIVAHLVLANSWFLYLIGPSQMKKPSKFSILFCLQIV